jgi:hypothetical protein
MITYNGTAGTAATTTTTTKKTGGDSTAVQEARNASIKDPRGIFAGDGRYFIGGKEYSQSEALARRKKNPASDHGNFMAPSRPASSTPDQGGISYDGN